ncbi:MAG: 23S rRNA (pseudouridine(1915)-N(3))-methyltransferase RlmH [Solirubrobacterales bacterium]
MNIYIICVGKIKEKYLKDAIAEYSKRLSRYCKLEVIEIPDEKTPDNASEKEELQIKEKEGLSILKSIKDNMVVVTLDLKGKMLSSEDFSEYIQRSGLEGSSNIAFVIGGSLGLSKDVLSRGNFSISFSKMTFPHQLMRVILLEQIYRGYRIINGEPYHK